MSGNPSPTSTEAEAFIPKFEFSRLLNQDQSGRRISLLGSIDSKPALLLVERAAFAADENHLRSFAQSLHRVKNLGANDIFSWFLASSGGKTPFTSRVSSPSPNEGNAVVTAIGENEQQEQPPDLKLSLIYPCTDQHIKKYTQQPLRTVTETPILYHKFVRPWIQKRRDVGKLDWIFNIIEGRTEQEDVIYREGSVSKSQSLIGTPEQDEGFLLLPDLNWDRKTMTSLHLLCLISRRDIWTIRDLTPRHIPWLVHIRSKVLHATASLYPNISEDQLKLYFHYQPTYHHLHIHIVHVLLDAGATQAVGKAFGVENIMSMLEVMGDDKSMSDASLTYTLGEESELWTDIFLPHKEGKLEAENE
jgi:m7GpppX diphosphatase